MTLDNEPGIPQVRPGPIGWLSNQLRAEIENAVSEIKGYRWRITDERDFSEFAFNQCAVLSNGSYAVFFKMSQSQNARAKFELEESELRYLSTRCNVRTPKTITIHESDGITLMIMEALDAIDRGTKQWREMGKSLAKIHLVKGEYFGFQTNGYWGPLFQDNRPDSSWSTFFVERRIIPLLKIAVDSENIPEAEIAKVEKVVERIPELCGPEIKPTLLHGDSHQNNFISTEEGAYVIDPAIHYGDPEYDLALVDSFQPVPHDFFEGYQELLPIASDFDERRDLYRIPLYLSAVALEGPMHLELLRRALGRYS